MVPAVDLARLVALAGIVAPVFAVIAVGWVLARRGILREAGAADLHRLVYWVGLPATLVVQIGSCDLRAHFEPHVLVAAAGAYVLVWAATWAGSSRLEPEARGCLLNGAVRGNGAFIGLPVALLLAATLPEGDRERLASGYLVVLGVMVPLFNIGAVLGFLLPRHGATRTGLARAARESLMNPLVIACVLGAALSLAWPGLLRPDAVAEPGTGTRALAAALHLLADFAVPLALLLAGAQLDLHLISQRWRVLASAAALKLAVAPLVTWLIGRWLGLDTPALAAAVLIMAAPTAMASVPMARALGADDRLMGAMVVLSTLLAPATLLVWLAVLTA